MTHKLTAASEIKSIEPAPNCLVVRLLDQSGVSRGGILLPEILVNGETLRQISIGDVLGILK